MPKGSPNEFKTGLVVVGRLGDLMAPECSTDFELVAETSRQWTRQSDLNDDMKHGRTSSERSEFLTLRREKYGADSENEIFHRAAAN